MEATGIYHYELCEFLQQDSALTVSVVNPYQTKSYANSLLLRTKTDKVDSKMLAQYCYERKPKAAPKLSKNLKRLRSLVRLLDTETKKLVEEQNRLQSTKDEMTREIIKESILFKKAQMKMIEKKIMEVINEDKKLKKDYKLLLTIPCVGNKTAWVILSEYYYVNPEDIRPKACVAHAGLTPKRHDSGSDVNGKSPISKIGVAIVRNTLYMPSLVPIGKENYFSAFYNRLIKNGKAPKVAITAVSRKILLTAMGVLKNQQPFDPNWAAMKNEEYHKNLKVV